MLNLIFVNMTENIFYSPGFLLIVLLIPTECLCPFGTFGSRCQFQCHCKSPLDCEPGTGNCASGCRSPWSGRNCQQENIALNASTEIKAGEGSTNSSYGIDDNLSTCAITKAGQNGWWMLKFQKPQFVNKIFLAAGGNTPLYDWQILVGDYGNIFIMRTCVELKTYDSSVSIFCDRPQEGTYLAVFNRHGPVVVCELSVYVCTTHSFGTECENECACKDSTEQCDTHTGSCSTGCRPGRLGINCQTECNNTYGPNCEYPCGHCHNDSCDSVTGICLQKCQPGWTGITCDRECQSGFYGYNCNNRCGPCLGGNKCDIVNGECPSGCEPGWIGHKCKTECNGTQFGKNCTKRCDNCFANSCHKQTGTCLLGCKPGFHGNLCDSVCTHGSWGLRCDEHCGQCQNKSCNAVNGNCSGPCLPGWTGLQCLDRCSSGTFGINCKEECGKCRTGTSCNTTSGVCHNGCQDGFEGELCTPKAPLSSGSILSDEPNNSLQVFLGISVTIVVSVMACLILCLVSNWRREDISKYDRTAVKCDINMEEITHLNCNGGVS